MMPPLCLNPQPKECILDMGSSSGRKDHPDGRSPAIWLRSRPVRKNKVRSERLKYNLEKQGAPVPL